MKLAAKLILIFLLGVLCIVGFSAWQTTHRQRTWEQQRRESHATQLVDAVSPAITKAYEEGGTITVERAVEISSRTVPGTEMQWVNGNEVEVPKTKTTARQVSSVSVTNADGTRTAYSYVPLRLNGEDAGLVMVSQAMRDHDDFLRHSVRASIISLVGVTLLSGIVIYVGGVRLVGRPLDKLIDQVKSIGEGDLAQPPALTGNDELGRLAVAISEMGQRLKTQQETIRHTDRLGTVGTLAAGVAHELGTPLNVVSGRASLIAGGKLSAEEVAASAATIKEEADRMTTIIRQLLDFARQKPAPHESIDLNALIRRTCDLMEPLARKANVSFDLELANDPLRISGDASQTQQVVTNLISNAIAAMPDGGAVKVKASHDQPSNTVCIEVSDTGVGILPDDLPHVFEPFYTTKDVGQGTGLGLSIAYGIVQEHDGAISVVSTPGEGSTFVVTLPALLPEEEAGNE